ncbi:hypothetical protein MCOR27_003548 [Pyricularia oryzae]|uniref:Uncharacterized protein n=5 Tax=Pyricularia TaxID=48558 RepID=A0ABQ8NBS1_PYRGI|nr:uncharacterized protein MGG_03608 [Pyricularia oryzae 70-15]KAH8844296.1 hypothetical protein MCOR01_005049 [Pyricularia oryzae]KAI6294496.1 hypothetical protein MCOR33_008374 [Pyricularia grisea]EHA49971.1 hypothetical protein MGG_03608 [Pyricularia oryzae 70-15]KAH9431809.1 hypothetical protein MCOR02_009082 [Pyricularia oryzae]KAI6261094.1 hypothetical protein MCOR19_002636 [Pyricularia oryzae]
MEVAPVTIPAHDAIAGRKRKADAQDTHNERLSKRLSLLNLEKNGTKMYVTVENPAARPDRTAPPPTATTLTMPTSSSTPAAQPPADTPMQLDDDKYKVYIYNIDDELSSDSEPETDQSSSGRLIFLPDVEKHLLRTRIPPVPRPILPNADGELAGKQLVLYSVPSSLSVPEDQDSVRRAILDARARSRARAAVAQPHPGPVGGVDGRSAVGAAAAMPPRLPSIAEGEILPPDQILSPAAGINVKPCVHRLGIPASAGPTEPLLQAGGVHGIFPLGSGEAGIGTVLPSVDGDPDAMELD